MIGIKGIEMQRSIIETDRNRVPASLYFEERIPDTRKRLYAIAYKSLHNRSDAEDVAQEALVRAWSNLHTYDPKRSFNGWISRIATNICIDRLRRCPVKREISLEDSLSAEPYNVECRIDLADYSQNPERLLLSDELDEGLKLGIQVLPAAYRDCLLLFSQDHSYNEIAATMHCSVGTVRSRLHRARAQVITALESHAH
jgi:RNA polymerase sigma-70 factor (ECF subfamily)